MTLRESVIKWMTSTPKQRKVGHNCRKWNTNKYGVKVATTGHEVLPSGAIVK